MSKGMSGCLAVLLTLAVPAVAAARQPHVYVMQQAATPASAPEAAGYRDQNLRFAPERRADSTQVARGYRDVNLRFVAPVSEYCASGFARTTGGNVGSRC